MKKGLLATASTSSATVTSATTALVPNCEISRKPVRKTPRMLPAEAAAWIRPTTLPVASSELSESFTIIGVIVPSSTEGRNRRTTASHRTCNPAGQLSGAAMLPRSREARRISPEAIAATRYSYDSVVRPGRLSASLPPSQLPRLMPASTTPITEVHV
jgi:hypothetical protein